MKGVRIIGKPSKFQAKANVGKDINGKPIRKTFYSNKSKSDAKRKAKAHEDMLNAEQLTGIQILEQPVPFDEFALKCIEQYKSNTVKGNTYDGTYRLPVEGHLIPFFKDTPLNSIKPCDIKRYLDTAAIKYSYETLKKDRAVLKYIFDTAIEEKLCHTNPVTKNVKIPKTAKRTPQKRSYTEEQYNTVYEFAKGHEFGLDIMLLMETGITRSELLGLHFDNLDTEKGFIKIRQGLTEVKDAETGKRSLVEDGLKNRYRERKIPIIDSALLERLRNKPRMIIVKDDKGGKKEVCPINVFHSPEGHPYNPQNWEKRVYNKFMADLQEAHPEIPLLTPHELRHTRATLWVKQGINLITIARLLGHKDLKMLKEIYEHNDADIHKQELLEKKKDSQQNTTYNAINTDMLEEIAKKASAEALKALLNENKI